MENYNEEKKNLLNIAFIILLFWENTDRKTF